MAIRLRRTDDAGLIAICAARSVEKEGDIYLDDGAHMALAYKFWQDYPEVQIRPPAEVVAATEREESNNPARDGWDQVYAAVSDINTRGSSAARTGRDR